MNNMPFGFSDQDIGRRAVIMIRKDMLSRPFGQPEFGEGKKGQTKADGCRM
jgi:hypothetical protein